MLKKIRNILARMETRYLILLPLLIGAVPLIILFSLPKAEYSGTPVAEFLILLTFFTWGLMGLPMIIRKEAPWLIPITGWLAVVEGIVITLASWTVVIMLTVVAIRGK